ncbi:MAG TPA: efflux transporter outer membrane subunit [Magnetospirillaceae bacterium]|jgi:NodT family efflux transporter outer membrane factor (OMF) lipoprotein
MRYLHFVVPPLAAALTAGCLLGPQYERPQVEQAPAYGAAPANNVANVGAWNQAQPADRTLRGKWWEAFNDPQLNALEDKLSTANQTLKSAAAHYQAAKAAVGYARSAELPTVTVNPYADSLRWSNERPYFANTHTTGDFNIPLNASYEFDVWGRVEHTVNQSAEEAQAAAADLQTVTLLMHAELALDYFDLRSADSQKKLLDDSVKNFADALQLTQNRAEGGAAPDSDVAQAKTQLDTTRVQATEVTVQRAQLEHAIAVLVGDQPAVFKLAPSPLDLHQPPIPVGIPSELLQRRPDIAAAERRVAQANERIGIAKAAYYPSFILGAQTGFEGARLNDLFEWPSFLWAVGLTMNQTLFDNGRARSGDEVAQANYDAAVADYRQSVLDAYQQVEDNLTALAILEEEAHQQDEAVASAKHSLELFTNRYVGGRDTYLQVVTAQTVTLTNQRNATDILRRRMEASVLLIKALGGGWSDKDLPALADVKKASD